MKLYFVTFILVLFSCTAMHAQNAEVGAFLGSSYYVGEINQSGQMANQPNLSLGVFYRKNLSDRYSYRIGVNYGKLSASDDFFKNGLSEWRKLSFSGNLIEGNVLFEFNFLPYEINKRGMSWFSPYVFIGLAVFGIAPEIESGNTAKISKPESLVAPSIPFGMGVKFNFIDNMGIGVEWSMHKTFTDKIDGLPPTFVGGYQLSNSKNNDWYSFLGITLSYKFLTKNDRCPGAVN